MLTETIQYFASASNTELVAAVTALAYVIFAARGSLWCWPAALISTVLYTVVFYEYYLWSDSALQIYYFAMAIYGFWSWQKNKASSKHNDEIGTDEIEIVQYELAFHLKAIVVLAITSLAVGYVMDTYTPTDFPYLDAATTVFAVFGTYLVAKRVLENWLYWVVIDLVSIYLYLEKGLVPTAALFIIYVFIASFAYYNWRKMLVAQQQTSELNASAA